MDEDQELARPPLTGEVEFEKEESWKKIHIQNGAKII